MKKLFILPLIGFSSLSFCQSYAPAAGESGSTAIEYNDPNFVAWATHIEITRGFVNIEDTTVEYQGNNRTSFGVPENAIGPVSNITTDAVSLGDSGIAIITFNKPITNGPGFDFAVFENGLNANFLELAHVEVSSDGIHYVRFPSHSLTQTNTPVGGFGTLEPTDLYNLAGKYRVGFGTPFDLEELKDSSNLNVEEITHVKLIDVVGSLGSHGTFDSYGNKINDLFPTPFNTGGFDLSGVGVINENNNVNLNVEKLSFKVYPNPSNGTIHIQLNNMKPQELIVKNAMGESVKKYTASASQHSLQMDLSPGIYFIQVKTQNKVSTQKVIIQ